MRNGKVYFEIHADDPKRASDFYTAIFGWKFFEVPGLPVAYWRIETGGSRGGLLKRPTMMPPPHCGANAFVCSFEVANFDAAADKISKLGGSVALAKFPVKGVCWQGYFLDLEGNTFGIFQADKNAGL